MTPRWLLPVVASGAAIAVGVTAALVGIRFAEPETRAVDAPTIDAPVLGPIDPTVPLSELLADSADDELPVSPIVGIRTVVDPDSAPADPLPPDADALLDALMAAADPAEVPVEGTASTPDGDPCADGGTDCPDGVGGTLLPLDGELWPPGFRRVGTNDESCPVPDEPTTVRFVVQVNRPATVTVTGTDGWNRGEVVLEPTVEQIDEWLASAGEGERYANWITFCASIPGFRTDTLVSMRATAVAPDGLSRTFAFSAWTTDGLSVPPTRVNALGASMIVVSAPHTSGQRVQVLGILGDPDADEAPACRYGPGAGEVGFLRDPATETVSDDYLAEHAYEPDYDRRTSAVLIVPPSTRLAVCLGWFDAGASDPLTADRPIRVSEWEFTSPDVSAPSVTIEELALTSDVEDGSIVLSASTENGQFCGRWTGPDVDRDPSGDVLCDYGSLLGWRDADGSLVVTTEVPTASGTAVNRVLLDVGLLACDGGCAGQERSFDVPLSTFVRPARICSDDCTVNRGDTVGMVRLTATWPATDGTGDGWRIGAAYQGASRVERDPLPRLDTTAAVVMEPIDTATRTQDATVALRTDRPVTVEAVAVPDPEELAGACPAGAVLTSRSDSLATSHALRFENLCLGRIYTLSVRLTAADGAVSVYSATGDGTRFWRGSLFGAGGLLTAIAIDELRLTNGDPANEVALISADVHLGFERTELIDPDDERRCWVGDIQGLEASPPAEYLGEAIHLTVSAWVADADIPAGTDPSGPTSDCTWVRGWGAHTSLRFEAWVDYDDYLTGTTVTMTQPGTGWTAVLELSPR